MGTDEGKEKRLKNLKPNTTLSTDEAKKMGKVGGIASVKARKEKKLLSQMLGEWIGTDHEIKSKDGSTKNMSTKDMVEMAINRGLLSGGSVSIQTLKFLHEATEGIKVKVESTQADDPLMKELLEKHGI